MKNLIEKLNYYTKAYDEGNPLISDKEWDDLYFKLIEMEREAGYSLPNSPTQKIDYQVVNSLNKVEHNHPMLSLDKTKNLEEIKSFIENKDWIAMLKMDGLTCSLLYENGHLIRAETRGNGKIGEDITHNAMVIHSIPKKISYTERLVVDGEIICKLNDFECFKGVYKNARNFASGSIRLLDSHECAKRKLTFVAWDIIEGYEKECDTLNKKLEKLIYLNFEVVPFTIMGTIEESAEWLKNHTNNYPIDGLVYKLRKCIEYDAMGRTEHHFRGGMAYKFYDEEYETNLINITYEVSRNGEMVPVALFETINIDGTNVSRASLHNLSIMEEILGTPYVGQPITICKKNQIIPQIIKGKKLNNSLDQNN